ncbi:MAG: hypothetical protein EBY55_13280, partial [Gammaproteobacteria bacterium]|nr:hypothetical protein [Gammaproteobacteria bacterium]
MTTGISLVRENTASMQPPRALWVPFPLGRPLGKAGDANFQHQVIQHGLELLSRGEGPVLEDFPLDVPRIDHDVVQACSVSFPPKQANKGGWEARLLGEFNLLEPWYQLSLRRRKGRTLVGIAPEPPEENLKQLAAHLDAANFPQTIDWLKPATDDLKALYIEAMTAQPGQYDDAEITRQFWQETEFGAALIVIYEHFQ